MADAEGLKPFGVTLVRVQIPFPVLRKKMRNKDYPYTVTLSYYKPTRTYIWDAKRGTRGLFLSPGTKIPPRSIPLELGSIFEQDKYIMRLMFEINARNIPEAIGKIYIEYVKYYGENEEVKYAAWKQSKHF
jgi:hypothetical protein